MEWGSGGEKATRLTTEYGVPGSGDYGVRRYPGTPYGTTYGTVRGRLRQNTTKCSLRVFSRDCRVYSDLVYRVRRYVYIVYI